MDTAKPISINLSEVIRTRLGSRSRYVPGFVVRYMERLICQDKLNELLRVNYPRRGADFCKGVLEHLDVSLTVRGAENLPANSRVMVVSNHPLGGLDGMAMIAWLSEHYGVPARFVVNDLLMAIEPLRESFIPVNKHGSQSRSYAGALDNALAGNDPVVIYPAGLCSRMGKGGVIADTTWHKMFVCKAIESKRDIVPVFFEGRNSQSFYRSAQWRKRLGIKFNFEMILLPREVFRAAGSTFTLTVGKAIHWQQLRGGRDAAAQALEIRNKVYALRDK